MIIERNHGVEVNIKTLKYGDAFLYEGNLFVKIDGLSYGISNKNFQNAVLNLDMNHLDAFEDGTKVIPVKAKVTYEYI